MHMQFACKGKKMSDIEQGSNPILQEVIHKDGPLKELLVQYVGDIYGPEDNKVTVQMLIEIMATEFPEFVMAIAEENFFRGYEQALDDVHSQAENSDDSEPERQRLRLVTDDGNQK